MSTSHDRLRGKTCVVTGAAGSIGLAIAQHYARIGAKVALIDSRPGVVDRAEDLKKAGHEATGFVVDITRRPAVLDCFSEILTSIGSAYALVNCAGLVDQRPLEEVTPEILERVFRVNVYGTLYCIQGVLPAMKKRKEGKIINFSSKSGKTGSALLIPYSAAKGAVIALTQALACEVASYNIKVNCLCPGITEATGVWSEVSKGYIHNLNLPEQEVVKQFTEKIPLKRLARIDDIVDFVDFLTVKGEYCTGQAFNISGGREMH
ncbi:MAG TPA: SDR family oxidoreductase [Atribacteraceae bacterium]|nr:SDR family oxidoreductase [Atribacteraceae bacterium]